LGVLLQPNISLVGSDSKVIDLTDQIQVPEQDVQGLASIVVI
jgi:hypothetical protein